MRKNTLTLFNSDDLDALVEGVYQVLETVGIKVLSEKIMNKLEKTSLNVDKKEAKVKFPIENIQEVIDSQKVDKINSAEQFKNTYSPGIYGLIAPFYYDFETKTRQEANKNLLIKTIKFADSATNQQKVGVPLSPRDVPAQIEPLETLYLLLEYSHNPAGVLVHNINQLKYIKEIGKIWSDNPWEFFNGYPDFCTSPLTMGFNFADFVLEKIKVEQNNFSVGSMPISGGNAPVTIAGNIVQASAEILGIWIIIKTLWPDAKLSGGICSGTINMRNGNALYNTPGAMLQNLGACELFRERLGGHVSVVAGSDYIDSKLPGIQATFERTYRAMTIATFNKKPFVLGGTGLLDGGRMFSPEEFILERELGEGLWEFGQGIEVNKEKIALEEIKKVSAGEGKSFLPLEHTLKYFKEEHWYSEMLDWEAWKNDSQENNREEELLEKAHNKVESYLKQYEKPEIDSNLLYSIKSVISEAKNNLVK